MTMSARASARAFRLVALAVLAVVVGLTAGVGVAPHAEAAAYRFWSYWQSPSGAWSFSQAGPGGVLPADGSVEGWRFGITTEAGSAEAAPRVEPSFDALCGATPAQDGMKRVGLVVDFGEPAHAPDGEVPPATIATCAVVPTDANGYAVLGAAAPTRTESGLICAIDGYPANECAAVVDDSLLAEATASPGASEDAATTTETVVPSASDETQDSSSSLGLVLSLAVVAFIIVLAVAARRRSS